MSRGVSSVIGTVLLVAITVIAATAVGAVATTSPGTVAPMAHLTVTADADADRIALTHEGGDTLDVEDVSLTVSVEGQRLAHQPPVPFFAASGFESGPTGPFNLASDDGWSAGQTGGFRLASTNDPPLAVGDRVEVTVTTDGSVIARLKTTAT